MNNGSLSLRLPIEGETPIRKTVSIKDADKISWNMSDRGEIGRAKLSNESSNLGSKGKLSSWDPDADPFDYSEFVDDPNSFAAVIAHPTVDVDTVERLPADKLPFTNPLKFYGLEEIGVVAVLIGAIASIYFSFTKHGGGMNASDLAEVATGLAGGGFELASLAYARKTHNRDEVLTREIYEKEKIIAEECLKRDHILAHTLHRRDQTLAKKMHMIQMNNNMIQSQIQLASDLSLAANESLRDMYDASNQKLQTLILSSTVMFAALSTVIVQGQLPRPQVASPAVIWVMSFVGTTSFGFLFIAIVISIELLNQTSELMWAMAINHHNKLHDLLNEMDEELPEAQTPAESEQTTKIKESIFGRFYKFKIKLKHRRKSRDGIKKGLSKRKPMCMDSVLDIKDPKSFQTVWLEHEGKMQGKLEKMAEHRREFKKDTQALKKSLTEYWKKVQKKTRMADMCFYIGAVTMLACMVDYMIAKFTETYSDDMYDPHLTGWAILSIMSFFVAACMMYVIIERVTSQRTVDTFISSISPANAAGTPRVAEETTHNGLDRDHDSTDSLAGLLDASSGAGAGAAPAGTENR